MPSELITAHKVQMMELVHLHIQEALALDELAVLEFQEPQIVKPDHLVEQLLGGMPDNLELLQLLNVADGHHLWEVLANPLIQHILPRADELVKVDRDGLDILAIFDSTEELAIGHDDQVCILLIFEVVAQWTTAQIDVNRPDGRRQVHGDPLDVDDVLLKVFTKFLGFHVDLRVEVAVATLDTSVQVATYKL
jgi:hypothetical protein